MKDWMIFLKLFLNSKINCISTSFKKQMSILSHIEKKFQTRQFSLNCLSKKAPGSKKFFCLKFLDILKTVLVVDLTFNFEFLAKEMYNLWTK